MKQDELKMVRKVLDFVVKRCFNSNLFIVGKFTEFLVQSGKSIDQKFISKMLSELKNIIDIFFSDKK